MRHLVLVVTLVAPTATGRSLCPLDVPVTAFVAPSKASRQLLSVQNVQNEDDGDDGDEQATGFVLPGFLRPELPESDSYFKKYGRPTDITEESFGALLPMAEAVDEATGGWGLSYADLRPATPRTPVGLGFLATNIFYLTGGAYLGIKGDVFFGGLTELAGIVSFAYHYLQLDLGVNRSEVRLVLLLDYITAGATLLTGGAYMIQAGISHVPVEALFTAIGALASLSLCWVWEFGYPYIFWHSLWHILSAATGFLIGQNHLAVAA